jgi:hypothetical protein
MVDRRSPNSEEALTVFWNDLVRPSGAPDAVDEALSPETADAVRRLHALASAPPPASSRERVRRGLLESYDDPLRDKEPTMLAATDLVRLGPNGRATPMRLRPVLERPRSLDRRLLLAVATVLIMAILGAVAGALITNRLDSTDPRPAPAILAPGTPSPEAEATDETLVEIPLLADVLPPGELGTATLTDIVIPVGTFRQAADEAELNPGQVVGYVLDGTVTVISDEVMHVIQADGAGQVEEIRAGTAVVLEPGDTLVTRKSPGEEWTNEGPGEVRLIHMELFGGFEQTSTFPSGWIFEFKDKSQERSIAEPEAPAVMRLRRVAVAADAELMPPADAIVFLVWPENDASIGRASDGSVVIVGGQATTALIMTIEPAADTATPTP